MSHSGIRALVLFKLDWTTSSSFEMILPRLGESVPVFDRKLRISAYKTSRLLNILLSILLVNKSVTSLSE